MKLRKAFTLIELLIVIAIILILISIALPNFMAARLRAKVVETTSNMKTVGDAIFMCANDYGGSTEPNWMCSNNHSHWSQPWPCEKIGTVAAFGIYTGWVMIHFGNFNPGVNYMGNLLTTPVPYMERCPIDFFNTAMESQGSWPTFGFPASFHINVFMDGALDGFGRPWEVFWEGFMRTGPQGHPEMTPNFFFHLNSAGPDVMWWDTGNSEKLYSPTNGIRSSGDIWRFSNGKKAP